MLFVLLGETAGENFARDACMRPPESWSPRSQKKIACLLHSLLKEIQEWMVANRPRSAMRLLHRALIKNSRMCIWSSAGLHGAAREALAVMPVPGLRHRARGADVVGQQPL
jgi:hypothetical protein